MKQKILRLIKKLFGKRVLVYPIVDTNIYEPNESSYSGNSLQDSNVLIVGNDEELINAAVTAYKNEGCSVSLLSIGYEEMTEKSIENSRALLIGHFDHIVNIIKPDSAHGLFGEGNVYNHKDIEWVVYQWLQVEVDYLDKYLNQSSVHVVFVRHPMEYIDVVTHSVMNMLRGLARRLLVHGIIANGVVADSGIPLEAIMQSLMFVTGKYGEVIAGEFIELKN